MTDLAAWGVLGTGSIAHMFAEAIQASSTGRVAAVASRNPARAARFATQFGIDRSYGSYASLLDDQAVEIVYIATPHSTHVELAVAALRAGKHVLCEKPLAVNAAGGRRIVEEARSAGMFLMEAFAFRCHPQTSRLLELLEGDEIGELRLVQAPIGYDAGPAPANYLHRRDLAGGAILDCGCYPVSLTRLIAGHTIGRPWRDPDDLHGHGVFHLEQGVDLESAALAWYEGGISAQLFCSIRTHVDRTVVLTGTRGLIRLPAGFLPGRVDRYGGPPRIILERHGESAREIWVDAPGGLYGTEADAVVGHVRAGRIEAPEMTWQDSLANMAVLDRWRAAVGVRYDPSVETPNRPDRSLGPRPAI